LKIHIAAPKCKAGESASEGNPAPTIAAAIDDALTEIVKRHCAPFRHPPSNIAAQTPSLPMPAGHRRFFAKRLEPR
jgi:hypothetical protein